jgi:hypothetical protein
MTNPRHLAAALLTGMLVLGGTACGGGAKHPSTTTTASTPSKAKQPASGKTSTTKAAAPKTPKPAAGPKSNRTPLSQTPAKTLTFSGSGVKDIGKPDPLRIPTDSTIQWTNTGAIFQIIPASVHVQSPVNSEAHSGTATIRKGAYYGFLINAIGNWTVKIIPAG